MPPSSPATAPQTSRSNPTGRRCRRSPDDLHTLNISANGNANTYPLTTLCAALGSRTPTAATPFAKHDLAGHPAWLASLAVLRYTGVTIIDPQNGSTSSVEPVGSGTGMEVASGIRWEWGLNALERR
jgi:hypothetical protein